MFAFWVKVKYDLLACHHEHVSTALYIQPNVMTLSWIVNKEGPKGLNQTGCRWWYSVELVQDICWRCSLANFACFQMIYLLILLLVVVVVFLQHLAIRITNQILSAEYISLWRMATFYFQIAPFCVPLMFHLQYLPTGGHIGENRSMSLKNKVHGHEVQAQHKQGQHLREEGNSGHIFPTFYLLLLPLRKLCRSLGTAIHAIAKYSLPQFQGLRAFFILINPFFS